MISLNFTGGTVTHDDLSHLQDIAVAKQVDLLKEDMLQVEFAGDCYWMWVGTQNLMRRVVFG